MRKIVGNEIKSIELDILRYIDKCCKSNNLKYYLIYGTLLGAVRHKGFIPWDDDIDIAMPRNDFLKFIDIIKDDNSYYKLISCNNVEGYDTPLAKIVDSRTQLVQKGAIGNVKNLGIYVDLFIIDKLPNNEKERNNYIRKMKNKNKQWYLSKRKFVFRRKSIVKDLLLAAISLPFKIKCAYDRCLDMDQLASLYKNIDAYDQTILLFASSPEKALLSTIEWNEIISIEFEGGLFNATKYYDKQLTNIYGEYMTPPPVDLQQSTHDFQAYWK